MAYDIPQPSKLRASTFKLERLQAHNPIRGGDHQTVDFGSALWTGQFETTDLSRALAGQWQALMHKLRGRARTVYLYDPARQRPIEYHASADLSADWDWSSGSVTMDATTASASHTAAAVDAPAWGDPRVTAYDRTNAQITVEGLIAGAVISPGDYGAWDDGVTRRLVQVVDGATADASGVAVLTIEPAPPESEANLPAAFNMLRACGEFVITNWQAPFTAPMPHTLNFSAVQVLRRATT